MNALHNNGFRHLYQIYQGYQPSHAAPTWINTDQIGLSERFRVEWDTYINALRQNVIGLSTQEDRLVWSWNHNTSNITTK